MKTREQRALKIAEYEESDIYFENKQIKHYSSFNGLMPIVEHINTIRLKAYKRQDLTAEKNYYLEIGYNGVSIYKWNTLIKFISSVKGNLTDILQEAIIYYYENKESGE